MQGDGFVARRRSSESGRMLSFSTSYLSLDIVATASLMREAPAYGRLIVPLVVYSCLAYWGSDLGNPPHAVLIGTTISIYLKNREFVVLTWNILYVDENYLCHRVSNLLNI